MPLTAEGGRAQGAQLAAVSDLLPAALRHLRTENVSHLDPFQRPSRGRIEGHHLGASRSSVQAFSPTA